MCQESWRSSIRSGHRIDRRVFVSVAGSPDGMTVDNDDFLWVAIWGGSCVHRYAWDGALHEVIPCRRASPPASRSQRNRPTSPS